MKKLLALPEHATPASQCRPNPGRTLGLESNVTSNEDATTVSAPLGVMYRAVASSCRRLLRAESRARWYQHYEMVGMGRGHYRAFWDYPEWISGQPVMPTLENANIYTMFVHGIIKSPLGR